MTLQDAKKGEVYTLVGPENKKDFPKELSRRFIQKGDSFIYAGKVGTHHILKFEETRIGLHHQFVKDLAIEKFRD
jgi:hypothetical protein